MQNIKEFFSTHDKFAKKNNIILEDAKQGWAKASMIISQDHLNGVDVVHGGAIFTLVDFVFAVASNSYGDVALSINSSIFFINSAKIGEKLSAQAIEIERNKKLATYKVLVTNEDDKTIASFHGMVYIKNKTFIEGENNDME
jgi:acyl-CoA thioesterase